MASRQKFKKPAGRTERHSAAWGKRLSMALLLVTGMAYGQTQNGNSQHSRFSGLAPELTQLRSRLGATSNQPVNVIVTYKQAPQAAAATRVQGLGGRFSRHLHLVNGEAVTVPASCRMSPTGPTAARIRSPSTRSWPA